MTSVKVAVHIIMVCVVYSTILFAGVVITGSPNNISRIEDIAKVECFVHRDNPDVNKLCAEHGYYGSRP